MNKRKNIEKGYLKIVLLIFFVILIDQMIKIIVVKNGSINLIPGVLELSLNESRQTDFNTRLMYIATNIIVLIIVFKFIITQNQFITMKIKILLSLVFAGGLSNVIDRIFRGYVVEYIKITGIEKFPIFNIADIAFIIGWISFVALFADFTAKEWKEKREKK